MREQTRETDSGEARRPGPKPERLKIEGDPEEALRRILGVKKPAGGFPDPVKPNGRREKKRKDDYT